MRQSKFLKNGCSSQRVIEVPSPSLFFVLAPPHTADISDVIRLDTSAFPCALGSNLRYYRNRHWRNHRPFYVAFLKAWSVNFSAQVIHQMAWYIFFIQDWRSISSLIFDSWRYHITSKTICPQSNASTLQDSVNVISNRRRNMPRHVYR